MKFASSLSIRPPSPGLEGGVEGLDQRRGRLGEVEPVDVAHPLPEPAVERLLRRPNPGHRRARIIGLDVDDRDRPIGCFLMPRRLPADAEPFA